MPALPPRLLISAVSLAVVAACDPELAPQTEISPREASLMAAPGLDCLTDTKLRLHHDDGTLDVTTDLATGLAELARPRDVVELSFAVTPQCAADHRRLTLAAYTTQGINLGLDPIHPPTAFDVHTTRLTGDTYLLRVRLPDCYYELDLAFGEPLPVQRPKLSYAAQSRLIFAAIGGDDTCDEAPLTVERFDPVEAGWGDAPVSAHFGWRLTADPAAQLRCEFDFDADGQPDVIHEPCSRTTELVKTAALPQWTYAVGKHRPELVVSDGQRRIWAGTDIYANHLDYKPDVHFLEQRPDFLGADVTVKPAPDLSQVVLHFKDAATLPDVAAGEVVVGHGGARGYMLRVESVTYDDADLVLLGEPVGLDAVLAGGFFGVRDLPIDTSDIACVEAPCPDEIVVLPEPAGSGELVELGTLALDEDPIPPPGGPRLVFKFGGHGELHFSPGLDVRALRARRRLAQHPPRGRGDHADHPRQHHRQGRPHPVPRVRRVLPRDFAAGHPGVDHAAARAGDRGRLQVHRHRRCERHRHRLQGSHRLADRARDPRERLPRQLRRRHGPRGSAPPCWPSS
ncbi:hypothetical protein [Nannocystis pusilla]|uniref:hypothetical protein n=1 Tax=Nannocystis pusilla TaxID=889268 RepID=UPI003DA30922